MGKFKVTEKVQNSSDHSSGWYLLCCWTFCNQTCHGGASSWARVPCKKIRLLSLNRVTVGSHIIKYYCFYHLCWTADLFATIFNWMVHQRKLECFVEKLDRSFQGQDHNAGAKFYWIFLYLFSTTDLLFSAALRWPTIKWGILCWMWLIICWLSHRTKWFEKIIWNL